MPRLLAFSPSRLVTTATVLTAIACTSPTDPPAGTPVDCDGQPVLDLAVGSAAVIPVTGSGVCARLAPSNGAPAEYLVTAFSANGEEQLGGAQGNFSLYVGPDTFAPPAALRTSSTTVRSTGLGFHDRLRAREQELVARTPPALRASRARTAPVVLGDQRQFQVCADIDCLEFTAVTATARYVGSNRVVFLDDTVPANGYSQSDLDSVGVLFDDWLYPIDTTAFGRESDIDGNGQVFVLLTDQLNRLSGDCGRTGQVIVGYFFGLDLLSQPHSNQAEIFYGLVPDPGSPTCPIGQGLARHLLGPVFIHEFQHMISFNRHVLLAGGEPEQTWLNEGLSHFAEELGGRQVPDQYCEGGNCVDQFIRSNITNAYSYLTAPELFFLVEPGISFGSLAERGANWLFVRWLAEQAPGDSALGTAVTRRLLGADLPAGLALTGEANVAAVSVALIDPELTFPDVLAEWHAANYLEGRADLSVAGRLSYRSWNLSAAFDQLVLGPYPLRPDSTRATYRGVGALRGGSGRLVRVLRSPGDGAISVGLVADQLSLVRPYLAVRRIR